MDTSVTLRPGDELSKEVVDDPAHFLHAEVDRDNGDIYLKFATREALFEFGRSLMHEAVFGRGEIECYPLRAAEGPQLPVNGVRLSLESSRLFISYPESGGRGY